MTGTARKAKKLATFNKSRSSDRNQNRNADLHIKAALKSQKIKLLPNNHLILQLNKK